MLYIDRGSNMPIYQQIYEQMKRDIISGNLPVESRVISTRVLASELQVGRNSVENAYDQLRLEGYITSIPGSGYIVNKLEFDLIQESPKEQRQSKLLTEHLAVLPDKSNTAFNMASLMKPIFQRSSGGRMWQTFWMNRWHIQCTVAEMGKVILSCASR